jgi:RNase P/RNase MRP subunit POP5
LREDATLTFRAEFFNAFNHPQFNNPAVVDVSKSTFGQITSASVNPRLIQFALKYAF